MLWVVKLPLPGILLAFSSMLKSRFIESIVFICVLFVQPIVSTGSFALAKKKAPMRAYSFITEGGKASQGECDGEKKIPRKLKHLKEYAKAGSYMGSELQKPEIKGKNDDEMWKHFFRAKPPCNVALGKTPSVLNEKQLTTKPELPPDDSDDEPEQTEGPDSE